MVTVEPEHHTLAPGTRSALTRYRVLAYATGVFLLLLTLHMVLKYGFDTEGLGAWVAMVHGWLYLAYVVVAVDLWFRTRLPFGRMALVVIAGTVPFMSFVAERWVTRNVRALPAARVPDRAPERAAEPT
jgi:integral membrane protein